jgi:hypothetical protein
MSTDRETQFIARVKVCVAPTLDYNLQLSHLLLRDPLGAMQAGLNLEDEIMLELEMVTRSIVKNRSEVFSPDFAASTFCDLIRPWQKSQTMGLTLRVLSAICW